MGNLFYRDVILFEVAITAWMFELGCYIRPIWADGQASLRSIPMTPIVDAHRAVLRGELPAGPFAIVSVLSLGAWCRLVDLPSSGVSVRGERLVQPAVVFDQVWKKFSAASA
jgi:hypothetical protein